jgi:branched-chain amino acid transport system permease protein
VNARALLSVALGAAAVGGLAWLGTVLSPFHLRVGLSIFLSAGMAIGWYILGGFARYYSFGHTVFVGVGAFAAALTLQTWRFDGWVLQVATGVGAAMAASAVLAAVIALPILRLRGHYFTIAMLAVALVCAEAASAFPVFRGSIGLTLPDVAPPSVRPERFFYWMSLGAVTLAVVVAALIARARLGYGLFAIREDEDAAQMLGVPTTRCKVLAFLASGTITGLMGALYALNLGYITTDSVFRGALSLDMIVNSLVGGMGSLFGPLVGAVVMTLLTKVMLGDFLEYHLAITGLIVVAIVFLAPDGLLGLAEKAWRRVRGGNGGGNGGGGADPR